MADAEAWMAADAVISVLGDSASVAVAKFDAQTKVTDIEYSYNPEAVHPISGLVCAAIAYAADGMLGHAHSDTITLSDRYTCVAPSQTKDQGPGASVPVRTLIERSIIDLDPTAASHLLTHPDSDGVIHQLKIFLPDEGNVPFLKPCDVERVKLSPLASIRENFVAADAEQRTKLIETEIARHPAVEQMYEFWANPVAVESVGHFANAITVVRLANSMHISTMLEPDRSASRALEQLPPAPGFENSWTLVAGEPGVIAWAASITTSEHITYTVAFLAHDAENQLDPSLISPALAAILDALHEIAAD